jgi:hypothetical protein
MRYITDYVELFGKLYAIHAVAYTSITVRWIDTPCLDSRFQSRMPD